MIEPLEGWKVELRSELQRCLHEVLPKVLEHALESERDVLLQSLKELVKEVPVPRRRSFIEPVTAQSSDADLGMHEWTTRHMRGFIEVAELHAQEDYGKPPAALTKHDRRKSRITRTSIKKKANGTSNVDEEPSKRHTLEGLRRSENEITWGQAWSDPMAGDPQASHNMGDLPTQEELMGWALSRSKSQDAKATEQSWAQPSAMAPPSVSADAWDKPDQPDTNKLDRAGRSVRHRMEDSLYFLEADSMEAEPTAVKPWKDEASESATLQPGSVHQDGKIFHAVSKDSTRSSVPTEIMEVPPPLKSPRSPRPPPIGNAPTLISTFSSDQPTRITEKAQAQIQKVVYHPLFDTLTCALIVLNAICIGWEADYMADHMLQHAPTGFRVMEVFFCVVFTLEISIRMAAHGFFFFTVADWRWNLFDLFVVVLQLVEEVLTKVSQEMPMNFSVVRVVRALRLVRIVRLIRILRLIGELRTIISSLSGSMKSLFWTVVVLFLMIYIVAVYFTELVLHHRLDDKDSKGKSQHDETLKFYYGSLGRSLLSLYQAISGGVDWDGMVVPLMEDIHFVMGLVFSLYIAFALLAMMNVVTGVFVESALLSAKVDKDIYMVNHVRDLFAETDKAHTGYITLKDFESMLDHVQMQEYFKAMDLATSEAAGLFKLLDIDNDGHILAEEFLSGCMRLRGPAKALDLAILMKETRRMVQRLARLEGHLATIEG